MFLGRPEGNRPLGRPRRIWGYNIKLDVQEVGGRIGPGCSGPEYGPLEGSVNAVMYIRFP